MRRAYAHGEGERQQAEDEGLALQEADQGIVPLPPGADRSDARALGSHT